MSTRFLVALADLTAAPVLAQLAAPPGNRGVAMGHLPVGSPGRSPRTVPNGTAKFAFLNDPWGTYIELTEGLAPAK